MVVKIVRVWEGRRGVGNGGVAGIFDCTRDGCSVYEVAGFGRLINPDRMKDWAIVTEMEESLT